MNIIFFGTSEFAVPSFAALAKSRHKILSVITRPDKKAGRGMKVMPSPVKTAAQQLGLEIHQPEDVSSAEIIKLLKEKEADLFVVIAYGQILKKQVLDIPKKYCINLHASLLPKYRGAAPYNWVVINGEKKTSVTIIKLNERMDAGDIITSQSIDISDSDSSLDIYKELSLIGAETLIATIDLIEAQKETFTKQDEKLITYAPKLKKEDGLIKWEEPAGQIRNLIRGTQPWPSAYTYLPAGQAGMKNKLLKMYKAEKTFKEGEFLPGEVIKIDRDSFSIACGKDALRILEVQLEGRRRMSAEEFLRGANLKVGQEIG